jgi:hypothetical protein
MWLAIALAVNVTVIALVFVYFEKLQRKWQKKILGQFSEFVDFYSGATLERARRSLLSDARYSSLLCLTGYGYKIYSQNDEDGIIAEMFRRIGTSSRRFLEIGVGDGLENNTLALLMQGWHGAWIEGSRDSADKIRKRFRPAIERGRLKFVEGFVNVKSVAALAETTGGIGDLDLFGLDIDGNDYYILAELALKARVVVLEYNAKFPPPIDWQMKYREDHIWDMTDYFGASLTAYDRLMKQKGYSLVGCNITGSNAFFVRNDLLGSSLFLEPFTPQRHYEPARYWLTRGFACGHPSGYQADWVD